MEALDDPLLEVGCGLADDEDSWSAGAAAAARALSGVSTRPLSCVLVFASVRFDLPALLAGVASAVGDAPVIGATTAGEISDGVTHETAVVVALASPHLAVHVGVGRGVSSDWEAAVAEATGSGQVARYFGEGCESVWRDLRLEAKSAYGLLFSPGDTQAAPCMSFEILHRLRSLSRGMLPICGGSAADDWRMDANYVLHGLEAHPDSVLVAVLETRLRAGMGVGHGLAPTHRRARVTRCSDIVRGIAEGRDGLTVARA